MELIIKIQKKFNKIKKKLIYLFVYLEIKIFIYKKAKTFLFGIKLRYSANPIL